MTNENTLPGNDTAELSGFAALGITGALLKATHNAGFAEPKPIQMQAIPPQLEGRDIFGIAQTGSGKTAAFALPILSKIIALGTKRRAKTTRALILAPTRELAVQIEDTIKILAKGAHVSTALVLGGVSRFSQVKKVAPGVDILIATPGRLTDLVREGDLILSDTKWLVLDEGDRMLDMGFINDVKRIAKATAPDRQTALFSATMPDEIAELAKGLLKNPVRIEVSPQSTAAAEIVQGVVFARTKQKRQVLSTMLADEAMKSVIIFSRTKHGADRVTKDLERDGFKAAVIHGNKSQNARQKALNDFRDGSVRILVATDIAARGIDVPGISHVVNFDLPDEAESYVHRIGRTGRNGMDGIAITLCDPSENSKLRQVERIIRTKLPIVADHLGSPDPARNPAEKNERFEPANDRDRNGRRDGRRPGGEKKPNNGFGKKRFGDKPAFAGERKPEGAKPFKGNNKRRFGGKRPAARAA
ncbi:DEAD/DEAH box helicase [Mesorhizobium sp. ESP6-5]|uniref:DNA/RNA helicase, superfamily II n=1 Tax=Mesorhizobium australicum (strain HAMBI 3006 / LMG 24608 / WSM2073) TaxID=754035 RepID=L0KM83_MESAW|nr:MULTISPECIES: DEAD/DEAH box helicase [Mesorhizobium]AGB46547.1 DNA/RNA helicase, superfamily II [Mesorhizobium australicum WSM2073]MBZ9680047.1 DEAD/DEAH box helicase [Mesorhizobium sp. CO1-1-2]MBZ9694015.1 DEAD/DEAH box helicase [Mesorhizobium sp. CO1-1-9]MBZ9727060.1 DEAD/DEAH box helicase [Mesorhizobium sp. CO1-1-11]MBZ9758362.1 DEAD/DEAH box helicase [Mesorhizobium sp. ESP6-5]